MPQESFQGETSPGLLEASELEELEQFLEAINPSGGEIFLVLGGWSLESVYLDIYIYMFVCKYVYYIFMLYMYMYMYIYIYIL